MQRNAADSVAGAGLTGALGESPSARARTLPPPARSRVFTRVRQAIHARHRSPRTEKAYVRSSLANRGKVSASTQNQALSALLFLIRNELIVRDGKGRKDRVTLIPGKLRDPLAAHMERAHTQHQDESPGRCGSVELPYALAAKYPRAAWEWPWQWVFPATRVYVDRETGHCSATHLLENTTTSGRSRSCSGTGA